MHVFRGGAAAACPRILRACLAAVESGAENRAAPDLRRCARTSAWTTIACVGMKSLPVIAIALQQWSIFECMQAPSAGEAEWE